ncbi:MAG: hypothetical protein COY58_03740 [Gammaproteobacteria bacterium CG_4_10_14_0_8_um_filter_38_16]|nr:MAG: hypothetical protein COY58_03740 [Gammaproteobacteria bacterium CG_4_10_14_0_8_um_filter_38_16]PJA03692.1 MAG: hypothetical protein COX72_04125 [Gammaproteobacteria bacterium CG_4_10_14_0_2_um_filter_38_22]PJB09646.1 MAG: hypothetical protein CO120_08975 [Gammaproteobacteria bacterium CG_4_9_14_3_um_filter_38_9]
MKQFRYYLTLLSLSLLTISFSSLASTHSLNLTEKQKTKTEKPFHAKTNAKSWYVSWGYNKDYWSNSDIHISQPGLGNNFTIHNVSAGDCPGWTSGLFNKSLMGPQYNIRIGHYLNAAHTWGVELSFDHAKYNTNLYQVARISGTINGQPVNQNQVLTPQYFYYALHNGANLLMLNVVRRKPLFSFFRSYFQFAALGKLGAGVMLPHPENTVMGNKVDVGPKNFSNSFGWHHGWWQFGGWSVGAEAGFQLLFHKTVYVELTDKEDYVTLSHIQVYDGTASQSMWLNEVIGNVGVMF